MHAYFTYELKALGILEALIKWLNELTGGQRFTVATDHKYGRPPLDGHMQGLPTVNNLNPTILPLESELPMLIISHILFFFQPLLHWMSLWFSLDSPMR